MVFCNIGRISRKDTFIVCHNPYFNRWFSAIMIENAVRMGFKMSQSLF